MTNRAPRLLFVFEFTSTHYLTGQGQGLSYGGNDYLPLIISTPEITLASSDTLPGTVTIDVANAGALFSTSEDYLGKTIKAYKYDEDAGGSAVLWFSGLVESYSLGPSARFQMEPRPDTVLDKDWPPKMYESDDWRTHEDGNVNDTTIYNPKMFGAAYEIPGGYFNKLRLIPVYYNTVDDYYDYICAGPIEEFTTIYRENRVVDSDEYSWDDGTDEKYVDADGRAYAYVRFTRPQTVNGQYLEITADGKGLVMDGGSAQRNKVSQIKFLLSDSYWGLGESVNADSFTASAALDHISPLLGDWVIGRGGQQQSLRTILGEMLRDCFSFLQRNSSGEWQIYTDQTIATSSLTIQGPGGEAENLQKVTAFGRIPAKECIRNLLCEYGYNYWTKSYNYRTSERTVTDIANAQDQTWQLNYVDDAETADRIACYYQKDGQLRRFLLSYEGGLEGHTLALLNKITVLDQVYYHDDGLAEHVNGDFVVFNLNRSEGGFSVEDCKPYDEDVFAYSAGDLPTAALADDYPDYFYTPPSAPTNGSKSVANYVSTEGQTIARVTLTADAPSANFQFLEGGFAQTSGVPTIVEWFKATDNGDGSWSVTIDGLTPGLAYYLVMRAVNMANFNDGSTDAQHGAWLVIDSNYTMAGDTATPKAPGSPAIEAKLKTVKVTWSAVTQDTGDNSLGTKLAGYHLQIGNSNFSTVYWESSWPDVLTATNKTWQAPDAHAYGTTYYARIRAYTKSGNAGAYSSTVNSTSAQAQDSDIAGMTFDKLGNGTLTGKTLTIGASTSLAVTAGSINVTSSGKININAASGLNVKSGAQCVVESGGAIHVYGSAGIALKSGGNIDIEAGASITMAAAGAITLSAGTLTLSGATVAISASTLTISSTGQLVISNSTGIQVNSGGGVNISTGGGVTLNFTAAATASFYWDGGALGDLRITGSSTTQASAPYTNHPTLNIHSVTDGLGYLNIGGPGTSNRWYYVLAKATNTISLYAGSTYGILIQTNGIYLNGGNVYFGSNWELYPNSTTSAQIRYGGTWKFAVTQDGDVWAARDLIAVRNAVVTDWTITQVGDDLNFKYSNKIYYFKGDGSGAGFFDGSSWHTFDYT